LNVRHKSFISSWPRTGAFGQRQCGPKDLGPQFPGADAERYRSQRNENWRPQSHARFQQIAGLHRLLHLLRV
jgi:hypothetical protein